MSYPDDLPSDMEPKNTMKPTDDTLKRKSLNLDTPDKTEKIVPQYPGVHHPVNNHMTLGEHIYPSVTGKTYTIPGPITIGTSKPTGINITFSYNTADFKYSEPEFTLKAMEHITKTNSAHYSGGVQTVEFIMSNATTLDYLKGCAIKYIQRYGKKEGNNPVDLYKAVHYIMMMNHFSDKLSKE